MTYLLDTNSCIEQLRQGPTSAIAQRLSTTSPGDVALCAVVVVELLYGANLSVQRTRNISLVRTFCNGFLSLPFDDRAAEEYGIIRADLAKMGTPIGPNDLMIASIARAHQLTLVTHNTAEFARVPGLSCEDWQVP